MDRSYVFGLCTICNSLCKKSKTKSTKTKSTAAKAKNPTESAKSKTVKKKSDIALYYIYPQSLAEIITFTQQLGNWLNQPIKAKALSQDLQQRLQTLVEKQPSNTPQTLFIALNSAPLYTLNDPIVNDVLQLCGAQNWAKNSANVAPAVNVEQLLVSHIDGIVYTSMDQSLEQLIQLINGTQPQPITTYKIDPESLYRAGPRLFDAAEQLCQQIAKPIKISFTD